MPEHKTLSAPYEPLKPPEYKRNELGQFERPGKTLAKTQKKTGLIKKSDGNQSREPDGRFKNGGARPGAGRPPGSLNKTTVALKEAILAAGEAAGGEEGLVGYLTRLAVENSSAYASLLAKVLPSTLAASDSDGGSERRHITFTRIIVHPDGHKEIEGVTPKALPAPATPDASGT